MPGGGRFPQRTGPLKRIQRTAERIPLWRVRKVVPPGPPVGPELITGRGVARRRRDPWRLLPLVFYASLAVAIVGAVFGIVLPLMFGLVPVA